MKLQDHPDYLSFTRRLKNLPKGSSAPFKGILFRFVDPRFSTPASVVNGKGALKSSGRWHIKGRHPCLYAATSPETALQEALSAKRYYALPDYKSLPRLLVGLRVELLHLLDLTNGKLRQRLRISEESIASCDWRNDNNFNDQESVTQTLGRAIYDQGYEGLISPSSADRPTGLVVVVFPEKLLRDESVRLETPVTWA